MKYRFITPIGVPILPFQEEEVSVSEIMECVEHSTYSLGNETHFRIYVENYII